MFENVKNCGAGKFISSGQWLHPDRVIDSYELIFVTKGEVFITENGESHQIKASEILILQPHLRHYGNRFSENTEFFWLHWQGGPDITSSIKHRRIENPYILCVYLRQLLDARVTNKTAESMDYLTRLVLLELLSNSKQPNTNHIAEKAAAWIRSNCHCGITEAQVAATLGYHVDYLNRLFKANFAKTIKQYINEKRLELIKSMMLCDNLTLQQIAAKAGFTEYKYFLKFFKYHEKMTPTQFYRQHGKIHINSH